MRVNAVEQKRINGSGHINFSRWARCVLLEAAAGTRVVGPDLQAVHQANAKRAWLGALLDELLHPATSVPDRLTAIAQAAELVDRFPEILEAERKPPCS